MTEAEEKSAEQAKQSGLYIPDATLGRWVRQSAIWVIKHFKRSILPVLAALAVGAGAGGYAASNSSHTSGVTASTTAARPSATIVSPSSGASVARCTTVSGTATLPPGDHLWVLVQAQDPTLYYVEGAATTSSTSDPHGVDWTFQADIGASGLTAQYVIYAVVTDPATSAFLSGMLDGNTQERIPGGLVDKSLAPGVIAKPVSVDREGSENSPCD